LAIGTKGRAFPFFFPLTSFPGYRAGLFAFFLSRRSALVFPPRSGEKGFFLRNGVGPERGRGRPLLYFPFFVFLQGRREGGVLPSLHRLSSKGRDRLFFRRSRGLEVSPPSLPFPILSGRRVFGGRPPLFLKRRVPCTTVRKPPASSWHLEPTPFFLLALPFGSSGPRRGFFCLRGRSFLAGRVSSGGFFPKSGFAILRVSFFLFPSFQRPSRFVVLYPVSCVAGFPFFFFLAQPAQDRFFTRIFSDKKKTRAPDYGAFFSFFFFFFHLISVFKGARGRFSLLGSTVPPSRG